MTVAYDVFAETNPAFCTFLMIGFCKKYIDNADNGPELGLLYIALPLALSDDLEPSFEATASSTGLLAWLHRYPDTRLGLGARLHSSKDIVSAALRFGVGVRALSLGSDGIITLGTKRPATSAAADLPDRPKRALKRAERLGTWMGKAGATGTIFSAFGVIP